MKMYRSIEVCKTVGITYKQLDYWCSTNLIQPKISANGSGTFRYFSEKDASFLIMVKQLLDSGMSLHGTRKIFQTIVEAEVPLFPGDILVVGDQGQVVKITNYEELLEFATELGHVRVLKVPEVS